MDKPKPVAYAIYGIGGSKHYLHNVKPIKDDEWETDDDCLGDYWAGNAALVVAPDAKGMCKWTDVANALQHIKTCAVRQSLAGSQPARYRIEHDGFEGIQVGSYTTLEGKEGVVLQQIGSRVVHVYGKKWLQPLDSSSPAVTEQHSCPCGIGEEPCPRPDGRSACSSQPENKKEK